MSLFRCLPVLIFLVTGTAVFAQQMATLDKTIARLEESRQFDSLITILEHSIYDKLTGQEQKAGQLEKLILTYIKKGDYVNASTSSVKLIEWHQESNSLRELSKAYSLKATAEYFLMNLPEAVTLTEKSYHILQQLGDTAEIIRDLIRLGILYQEMDNNEEAIAHYRAAAAIPTGDLDLLSNIYASFSVVFSALGQHDSSLYYIKKSIGVNKRAAEPKEEAIINSYYNLAATYMDMENYKMAVQSLDSTRQYSWDALPIKLTEKILAAYYSAYFKLNDLENGNLYLKNYISFHDKVYQDKMNTEIKSFKVLYENEKVFKEEQQQMKINELMLQKWILSLVISGLVLVIAGGGYSYHSNRKKIRAENDKIKVEQRLLRTQMNPHFILNTLAGIQMQVEEQQTEKASDYLSSFGRLMQITLENSRENFIPVESEIKALENYLRLQLMRFEDEFKYSIHTEDLDGDLNITIPPMIIQPFVENAIQHGIRGIERKGCIKITIKATSEVVSCIIEDNGKGLRSNNKPAFPGKKSLSTQIVRERLNILSSELKKEASLTIIDKTEQGGHGVKVIINIPYPASC